MNGVSNRRSQAERRPGGASWRRAFTGATTPSKVAIITQFDKLTISERNHIVSWIGVEHSRIKIVTVREFKAHFSEALDAARDGETIVVSYGRIHRKVAAMVPYSELKRPKKRPLGLLKSKARVRFARDFVLSDHDLLNA